MEQFTSQETTHCPLWFSLMLPGSQESALKKKIEGFLVIVETSLKQWINSASLAAADSVLSPCSLRLSKSKFHL